jgi:pilus assembly protein Flp/PilA
MTGFRHLRRRVLRCRIMPVLTDRRGATAVEYGLIVALVVLAMVGALGNFARGSSSMWANVSERVVNAR